VHTAVRGGAEAAGTDGTGFGFEERDETIRRKNNRNIGRPLPPYCCCITHGEGERSPDVPPSLDVPLVFIRNMA